MENGVVERVIELYDGLVAMPYSAVQEIEAVEQELTTLLSQNPQQLHTLVALLQTKVMLGKAEEGTQLAEKIWKQGGKITPEIEITFMNALIALGMFSHAFTLAKPKLKSSLENIDYYIPTLFHSSVALGDMETLQEIASLETMGSEGEYLSLFIQHQREEDLFSHFKEQQKIINSLLFKKQCGYEILIETERGWPELEVGVFVGGDSVDRYQLQVAIDKAQAEYYESVNVDPLDNFMITIYDIKEHWATKIF